MSTPSGSARELWHQFCDALREAGDPLFRATDAEGTCLPDMGLRRGRVSGSFAHGIDAGPTVR